MMSQVVPVARPLPFLPGASGASGASGARNASALSREDREKVLRFAASFLWADLEVAEEERRFLGDLARELEIDDAHACALLACPPVPEEIDPNELSVRTADVIRQVALRAIASDGQVREEEMTMFELLDDLLPGRHHAANDAEVPDEAA